MKLTPKTRQALKAKAHSLNPIVAIGNNGFSDAVRKELDRALADHELIKVKVSLEDRDARKAIVEEMCIAMRAELVQQIGKIVVLFRKNKEE